MLDIVDGLGRHRMAQPLIALGVDVELRAEGALVELHLGALIDDRPLVAAERQPVLLALEEILAQFRADVFEQEADMGGDRIVAQDRVAGLQKITNAKQRERGENRQGDAERRVPARNGRAADDGRERKSDQDAQCKDDEARRKCESQSLHESPPKKLFILQRFIYRQGDSLVKAAMRAGAARRAFFSWR